MISLATYTASATYGALIIQEDPASILESLPARVSRVKTLDGGVVVNHGGFAHGDRTFAVKASKMTSAEISTLKTIHTTQTIVGVSAPDGYFSAAIEKIDTDVLPVSISLLLKAKLSA